MADPRAAADRSGRLYTLLFVGCFAIVGFALYLQHVENLDPCPWCIVQRVAFLSVGLVALLAALWRPNGPGITVFAVLAGLVALGGAAAAGYHIWLQADDARASACAGSLVEKLLDASRIGRWVPPVLQYDGVCTAKAWALMGLSIPEWSLACFVAIVIYLIALPVIARR